MSVQFTAMIRLYPTNAGGRSEPLSDGTWDVVLAANGGKSPARFTFEGAPAPGDDFTARVELLTPTAGELFQPGTRFVVWDNGTRGVGAVGAPILSEA